MNMSRGSMLLWLIVTEIVFTMVPSIATYGVNDEVVNGDPPVESDNKEDKAHINTNPKKDSKLDKLKSLGSKIIPKSIKKKKKKKEPDMSQPTAVGYNQNMFFMRRVHAFSAFFRDLYKMDMKKSSLVEKLRKANKLEGSPEGLVEYKVALTEAIEAKDKLEDAKAALEKASPAEKDKFQAVVDEERKKAKEKVTEVQMAEDNMRKWYQRNLIRPGLKYGPGVGLVGGVIAAGIGFVNKGKPVTPTTLDPVETDVTYNGIRATRVHHTPVKRSPIKTILTIAFAIMLVIVITVVAILLARQFGLITSSERSNSGGMNNKEASDKSKMKEKSDPNGTENQGTGQATETQPDTTTKSGSSSGDSSSSGTNKSDGTSTSPTDSHNGQVKA